MLWFLFERALVPSYKKAMNILITGASGFIGSRIAQALGANSHHQLILTGRKRPATYSLPYTFIAADLTQEKETLELTKGVDVVIHCAGLAGTWGDYQEYYLANVLSTENLLKSSQKNGVKRFINISSPSIYFDYKDQFNLREGDLPPQFSNAYAQTKYEGEVLTQKYHSENLWTVSLRPRSVIGAGDNNVLPRLIHYNEQGQLKIIGKGLHLVDITTIGNLLQAVELCLQAPQGAMGTTYNISNGQPELFWNFVDSLLSHFGTIAPRRRIPYALAMGLAQINQILCRLMRVKKEPTLLPLTVGIMAYSMTMDISHAREHLGYRPRYSTADGIEEFVKWWKEKNSLPCLPNVESEAIIGR